MSAAGGAGIESALGVSVGGASGRGGAKVAKGEGDRGDRIRIIDHFKSKANRGQRGMIDRFKSKANRK